MFLQEFEECGGLAAEVGCVFGYGWGGPGCHGVLPVHSGDDDDCDVMFSGGGFYPGAEVGEGIEDVGNFMGVARSGAGACEACYLDFLCHD